MTCVKIVLYPKMTFMNLKFIKTKIYIKIGLVKFKNIFKVFKINHMITYRIFVSAITVTFTHCNGSNNVQSCYSRSFIISFIIIITMFVIFIIFIISSFSSLAHQAFKYWQVSRTEKRGHCAFSPV